MESSLTKVVDSIIGKPFRFRARGPDAYDCLGVVIHIYREAYQIELGDPFSGSLAEGIDRFKDQFVKLPDLQMIRSGDILYLGTKHKISDQHLAFVESQRWNVAATPQSGVVRLKLKSLLWYDQIDAYRYGFDYAN